MNKGCIIAWMDDMDMGARLARLSTVYSYTLEFVDDIDGILKLNDVGVIIIDLDVEGEAYKNNLRKNDTINEINRTEIKTLENYTKEIENYKSGDVVMVRIIRDGQNIYEAFEIK